MQGTCSHCGKEGRIRKGLCDAHYFRQWRTGDLGPVDIATKRPGATCTVTGCDAPHGARGYCAKHLTRVIRHGDPLTVLTPAVKRGEANPTWKGDLCGYTAAHDRVRRALGSARNYTCECGDNAAHWAYDHADPCEKRGPEGPYSPDLAHYRPMCVPCHKRMDLAHLSQ